MQNLAHEELPLSLPGFEHIKRYWDKATGSIAAKILPGEFYVTVNDEIIVTVLGSCVSACIRDRVFGIGGMNHFMLPVNRNEASQWGGQLEESTRFGNFAMEKMINEILKHGGNRKNLEVKLFGGGKVITGMTTIDVGRRNIDFVREYVQMEELNLVAEDLGDIYPRKVVYNPKTGKVRVKKLRSMHTRTIVERETSYMNQLKTEPPSGDVELF